jgi:hypothetical protein
MPYSSDLNTFFNRLPLIVKNVTTEYSRSITENRFLKYKKYLIEQTTTKKVLFNKNNWSYAPHLFCSDHYGEDYQYIYPVILTVNNINSIHEFISENFKDLLIYAPTISSLETVLTKK